MAGFVLVHGAFHGGWCFDPIADLLRGKGHLVDAPDLPGMGGDEAALRAVTLEGWAEFTLERCRAARAQLGGEPLILAGHSRGGMVIAAAAEADPSAMDGLVYICAMMHPADEAGRQSMVGTSTAPELLQFASAVANGAGVAFDPAWAGHFFAQLSPPELAEAAAQRLATEPAGPFSTIPQLTPSRWGSVPRTYVECLQDRAIPIATQRRMVELSPGTMTVALDADHSPFYSAPEALADALSGIAEASVAREV